MTENAVPNHDVSDDAAPNPVEQRRRQRLGAYVICVRDGTILLARWLGPHGPRWTLVGGGVEFGEDPADAALREFTEETGYVGRLDQLLGIDSLWLEAADQGAGSVVHEMHSIRVVYEGTIIGGDLRPEVDGSTDQAAWIPFDQVPSLDRVGLVDQGIALYRQRPATGQISPLPN